MQTPKALVSQSEGETMAATAPGNDAPLHSQMVQERALRD